MHINLLLSITAACLAAPSSASLLDKLFGRQGFTPAPGTTTSCAASDKIFGFYQGPSLDSVVNDACAGLMPPCAYQQRLNPDTFCAETIDFSLDGPKSSVQNANVEETSGNKISGYAAKFSVNPPFVPPNLPPVQWTRQECVGYFTTLLDAAPPQGCHTTRGSGTGSMIVGGRGPLSGTLFGVSVVPRP